MKYSGRQDRVWIQEKTKNYSVPRLLYLKEQLWYLHELRWTINIYRWIIDWLFPFLLIHSVFLVISFIIISRWKVVDSVVLLFPIDPIIPLIYGLSWRIVLERSWARYPCRSVYSSIFIIHSSVSYRSISLSRSLFYRESLKIWSIPICSLTWVPPPLPSLFDWLVHSGSSSEDRSPWTIVLGGCICSLFLFYHW